jgi:peptidoglycan hydrolase-like protein with peptidoglycan-binding domain
MTPGRARFALLSFLVVMTGVVINALFLQSKPVAPAKAAIERPAVRAPAQRGAKHSEAAPGWRAPAGGTGSEHPLRIARFAPEPAALGAQTRAPQEDIASARTVAAIQRELTARGYGPLSDDGVAGLTTRAAIVAFEQDNGFPPVGEVSERTLERIVLGSSGTGSSGASAKPTDGEQIIRTVQQRLAALGYPVGRTDGHLGEQTLKAVRDFEVDSGLVPKGAISPELVARLGQAVAGKSPAR